MRVLAIVCILATVTFADQKSDRADVLARMQQVMGELPDRSKLPAFDVKVHETFEGEGYTRQTISFANLYDERVTAFLYIPAGAGKHPAALALQPTGLAGKNRVDVERPYGKELAQRGYIVIAPDYPSFGEQKDYDFKKSKYASGTMKAISDNMCCIDLLQSRDDVDKEKIACIGHSLGGHNTLFTAAFDERIKVAVTSCGWTPFHFYYGGKKLENWAQDRYMPRVRDVFKNDPDKMPFDFPELIMSIAPRVVFSNSPEKDGNFEVAGVRQAEPKIKVAMKDFVVVYPDCEHDFPDDVRRQAYQFIDKQFDFKPAREVP